MTTASTLSYYLKDDPTFMGCYSKDNLPNFPKQFPSSMIVNNGKNHWVALILLDKVCFYFDSLAHMRLNCKIKRFLSRNYTEYIYNVHTLQHSKSTNCGLFCCAFIKCVKNKTSFSIFLSQFDIRKKMLNDDIIKKYFV